MIRTRRDPSLLYCLCGHSNFGHEFQQDGSSQCVGCDCERYVQEPKKKPLFPPRGLEQDGNPYEELARLQKLKQKKSKGNKHYRTGYRLERDVKIALEQEGYLVFRTAGSHGIADLIVFRHPANGNYPAILIQCKRHRNLMTSKEITRFAEVASKYNCIAKIAYRDKGIHLDVIG